ncbi:MAG: carbohydrate porin [Sedimentisphaerales bacterium]|nr:carbohydrate porin [Sedimentisphaerales bacterium]
MHELDRAFITNRIIFAGMTVLVFAMGSVHAEDFWTRETLTEGFGGLTDILNEQGLDMALNATHIYQVNTRGGLSTHHRRGRHAGSYDLEMTADMETWMGIEGASVFMHAEGWWSKSQGIDGPSVGSAFGVNADAMGRDAMVITELYWEQSWMDGIFKMRIGKMDLTGGFEHRGCPVSFDCNRYANDETAQFLNGALVNNPTIPFPDYALGAAIYYAPEGLWYLSAGVVDAQNDHRETGFHTAFHKEDYFFYILETGITPEWNSARGPLAGAYRVGIWNDPQPKSHTDTMNSYRDDVGVYVSCDQMLVRESSDPQDTQGLGTFFRYGYAPSRRNDITNFWSAGLHYQGLLDRRDEDILGIGYAQGFFSDQASATYPQDYESAMEVFYNARVTPYLHITPSLQYVANPGGSDAVVFGIRMQMTF